MTARRSRLLELAVLAIFAGCSKPDPPSPQTFESADDFERCLLTEPRGARCIQEVQVSTLRAAGLEDVAEELSGTKATRGGSAREAFLAWCHGVPAIAEAVFACWAESGCGAFADCVVGRMPPETIPFQ
jgi:hypothetical protein